MDQSSARTQNVIRNLCFQRRKHILVLKVYFKVIYRNERVLSKVQ